MKERITLGNTLRMINWKKKMFPNAKRRKINGRKEH